MKRDFKSITVGWGGFLIYILNNSKWYILSVSAFLLFTLYFHPYISEIQSLTTGLTHQYLVTYNMWHMSIGIQQKQIDQQHAKKPYVFFCFFYISGDVFIYDNRRILLKSFVIFEDRFYISKMYFILWFLYWFYYMYIIILYWFIILS